MKSSKENSIIVFELSQNMKNSQIHNFEISDENYLHDEYSMFDTILIKSWLSAMEKGLFKFKLEGKQPYKYLDGKYSFVVQLNEKRISEKRPTEIKNKEVIVQPFDETKFNFTKINKNEILFKTCFKDENFVEALEKSEENQSHFTNYVIINSSPIDVGHVLFVPQLYSGLNQVLTIDAIRIAVSCLLISKTSSLLIGFNSVNAYASVNHLHLHGYYINFAPNSKNNYTFPIQNLQNAKCVAKNLWYIDEGDFILPGFILQLSDFENNFMEFCRKIFEITNYLSETNVPHNVVFVKSNILNEPEIFAENTTTIRAIIWPKKPAHEIAEINDKFYGFAICELSGHFIIPNKTIFDEINEDEILRLATFIKLDNDKLNKIKQDVEALFK